MRVLSFSFKFSPVGHGKILTNALLHHAFPRRHQLLFAYDYNYRYEFVVCNNRNPVLTF
jgi:myotubularin-related protein 10/11/12